MLTPDQIQEIRTCRSVGGVITKVLDELIESHDNAIALARTAVAFCAGNIAYFPEGADANALVEQVDALVQFDEPLAKCDDCGHVCAVAQLNEAQDLDQRLDYPVGHPKCIEPAGECPKCGALAYEVAK